MSGTECNMIIISLFKHLKLLPVMMSNLLVVMNEMEKIDEILI